MGKKHILVVDNERELLDLINLHLTESGMQTSIATSGDAALALLDTQSYDLIILDIMMEGLNGFEVLERIRNLCLDMPIILLSAKHEDESKVFGLGLGADDYVTKPFSTYELIARVQAHLRRANKHQSIEQMINYTYGSLTLDPHSQTLFKKDIEIMLSAKEVKLLSTLMKRPNQVIAKINLFEEVWGHQHYDENSLNVYINYLRNKIEDEPRQPKYIQTIWGIGYRFAGD